MPMINDDDQFEVSMPGDDDAFLLNGYEVGESIVQRLDEAGTETCVALVLHLRSLASSDETRTITVTMTDLQAMHLRYDIEAAQ